MKVGFFRWLPGWKNSSDKDAEQNDDSEKKDWA